MEICVKCFFDNKPEFEKALNYLKPIVGNSNIAYSGRDVELKIYVRKGYPEESAYKVSIHYDDNMWNITKLY